MSTINLGLLTAVASVAGTAGQVLVNGQYAAQNGKVVISLEGSFTGVTGIYAAITGLSGFLITQIQSAAGVLSLNNATGLLTLASAPANANYVKVTTSGTTIMVSGEMRQISTSVAPGLDFIAVSFSPPFSVAPQVSPSVIITGSTMYDVCVSGITVNGYNALFSATTTETITLNTFASYG